MNNTNITTHHQDIQNAVPATPLAQENKEAAKDSPSLWDLNKDVLREITSHMNSMTAKSLYLTSHEAEDLHNELIVSPVPKERLTEEQLKQFKAAFTSRWDSWTGFTTSTLDDQKAINALGSDMYTDLSDAMKTWCIWTTKSNNRYLFRVVVHLIRHGATFDKLEIPGNALSLIYRKLAKLDDPVLASLFLKRKLPLNEGNWSNLVTMVSEKPNSRVLKMLCDAASSSPSVAKAFPNFATLSYLFKRGTSYKIYVTLNKIGVSIRDLKTNQTETFKFVARALMRRSSNMHVMKELIAEGLEIEAHFWSLLHEAVKQNQQRMFEYLMALPEAKKILTNRNDHYKDSPIFCITEANQIDMLRSMLDSGANLFARTHQKQNFLHHILKSASKDSKIALLSFAFHAWKEGTYGAGPVDWVNQKDGEGKTPLDYARGNEISLLRNSKASS